MGSRWAAPGPRGRGGPGGRRAVRRQSLTRLPYPLAHRGVEMAPINHRASRSISKSSHGPGLGEDHQPQFLHDRLPERRGRHLSIATDHTARCSSISPGGSRPGEPLHDPLPSLHGAGTGLIPATTRGAHRRRRDRVRGGFASARERANRDSLADLGGAAALCSGSRRPEGRIPRCSAHNKRDLRAALPVERLRAALNPFAAPEIEAVACEGQGVGETLKAACKAVIARLGGVTAGAGQPAATAQA